MGNPTEETCCCLNERKLRSSSPLSIRGSFRHANVVRVRCQCAGFPTQEPTGRSTMLLRQSPVKPKVGAGSGSENQNLVNAATFGAQNQWALPSSSTAHQRARFGALDQSTFMVVACHVWGKAANRFGFPQPERQRNQSSTRPARSHGNTSRTPAFNRFRMSPIFPNVTLCSPVSSRYRVEAEMPILRANTA